MSCLNAEARKFALQLIGATTVARSKMPPLDVCNAAAIALLDAALGELSHSDAAHWLRLLANEIEAKDPTTAGRDA